jgi:Na+/H+-dicarboxylate symporter
MDELLREIEAEKEQISQTLEALEEALSRQARTIIELAAIAIFCTISIMVSKISSSVC